MKIFQTNRVAIRVRYYGPTNYRGSRYKAWASNGASHWMGAKPELNNSENMYRCAADLCKKMDWRVALVASWDGYDMVCAMVHENSVLPHSCDVI